MRSFKPTTETKLFKFKVEGKEMQTTATSEGQAKHAVKTRYNRENNRQLNAFVNIELV